MTNRKYYGLRFPFTATDEVKFFVDADYDPYKEIKSDLIHLLFTPTGQRLRNPSFGSNLIKYVFEPNDTKTLTDIKLEMQTTIDKYFPNLTINQLTANKTEGDMYGATITIKYTIDENTFITTDTINLTL